MHKSEVQNVAEELFDFYATSEPWELVENDVIFVCVLN